MSVLSLNVESRKGNTRKVDKCRIEFNRQWNYRSRINLFKNIIKTKNVLIRDPFFIHSMIDTNADYPDNVGNSLQKDYKKEFQNKASQEYSSAKVNLVNCSCQKYNKSKYNIHERNNKKFENISTENISNKEKNYLSKSMIQLSKYSKMCPFNSSIVINTKDPHSSSEYLNKSFYKNKENNALSKIYMLNSLYMTTKRSSNISGIIIKKIFYFIKFVESLLLFLNKKATSNKNAFGRSLAFVLIVMTILSGNVQNASGKVLEDPHFGRAIVNVTAAVGREAILECVAEQLGNYKVAWLRVDTQTILTIHSHVITKNHRIGVTHSEHRTWYLHVKEVKESDRGWYMCQINTDPMKSQVGYLDIVVPPDILDIETSTDLVVQEGANVSLRCAARGSPVPTIMWKRENSETIRIGNRKEVISTMGSVLHISRVSRQQMGPYLCIASNGVPPSVSKRIMLVVHFPPIIWIQYQLIGAYDGQQIVLECNSEAFPKSINYWTADKGQIVPNNEKFESILMRDAYRVHMQLIIRDLQSTDYGIYKCISKNSLGETDGTINVYRIPKPSTFNITTKNKNGARSRLITDDDTYQTADFQTDIPDSQHLDVSNRSNLITIPKSVLLLSVLSLLSVPITLLAA